MPKCEISNYIPKAHQPPIGEQTIQEKGETLFVTYGETPNQSGDVLKIETLSTKQNGQETRKVLYPISGHNQI